MRVQCVGVGPSTISFDIGPFVQYIRRFIFRKPAFFSLYLSDYFTPPVWSTGIQRVQSGITCSPMRCRTQSQVLCPDRMMSSPSNVVEPFFFCINGDHALCTWVSTLVLCAEMQIVKAERLNMSDLAIGTWASTLVPYIDAQIVKHGRSVRFLSEIVAVVDQYRNRDLQMMSHGVFEAKQAIFCFKYLKSGPSTRCFK